MLGHWINIHGTLVNLNAFTQIHKPSFDDNKWVIKLEGSTKADHLNIKYHKEENAYKDYERIERLLLSQPFKLVE